MASTGGPFELGVVPREVFKNEAAKSKFELGPTVDIASVGLGVAVAKTWQCEVFPGFGGGM